MREGAQSGVRRRSGLELGGHLEDGDSCVVIRDNERAGLNEGAGFGVADLQTVAAKPLTWDYTAKRETRTQMGHGRSMLAGRRRL